MAVLGGTICRTPVSSPVRRELHSYKFWPAWTGIKAGTSAVAAVWLLMVGFSVGRTNILMGKKRK